MTKKGAANFLRWKFYEDLRMDKIKLHSLTASHPDYDHYGGMLDLLNGELYDGRTFDVEVDHFYHNGMGRFQGDDPFGEMKSGSVNPFPNPGWAFRLTILSSLICSMTSTLSHHHPTHSLGRSPT